MFSSQLATPGLGLALAHPRQILFVSKSAILFKNHLTIRLYLEFVFAHYLLLKLNFLLAFSFPLFLSFT